LVIGAVAFAAAVALVALLPSLGAMSTAGAAFFAVLAIKHVALAATVGLPAMAGVRRAWPRRSTSRPRPAAGADGYWRTGEAEPHRGALRLEHDVRALPATRARQAVVELDADKRMTLRLLAGGDGDQLRAGLSKRYAARGHRDAATVTAFLSPLRGPIARGESVVISYDAAAQTTRLALRATTSEVVGRAFMHATWRLWFDDAVPAGLADALIRDVPSPGITMHAPRCYDALVAVYSLGREARMRARTLDAAGVAAGDHVLDVCCGTGTLAVAAGRRVGAAGSVRAIDASPQMVARATAKAARAGVPVAFEVATAQALPFADRSFDVVLCSLGLHHLDRDARAAALAEMGRVVRPGGRIVAVELGGARAAPVLAGIAETMTGLGLEQVSAERLGFARLTYARGQRPVG
jgi:ubiquinone/menaquinone biosynthesis C-methylase UbiE